MPGSCNVEGNLARGINLEVDFGDEICAYLAAHDWLYTVHTQSQTVG
jgi:hypothetical protein